MWQLGIIIAIIAAMFPVTWLAGMAWVEAVWLIGKVRGL